MSRQSDVTNEVIAVIQAVIIILVTASGFLASWNHRRVVKGSMNRLRIKEGA